MKTKTMKKALSLFLAVLMIALAIPFTLLTFAEEATEIEITKFSVFGRHSDVDQTKLFFNPSFGAERAFDGDIGTEAQTKNGDKRPYEMCYIDADGKMQNGTNASGTSYCGIFIVELSDSVAVDKLSLWGIDSWGFEWMSNDSYDIYYSADGESYTAVDGASFENVCAKQSTADALYKEGTYKGKEGYVHDIAMGDVTAKYIAIAVADYVPASDNAEYMEIIFYEIVVMGTDSEEPIEPPAEEATEIEITKFSVFGRHSDVDQTKLFFNPSFGAERAFDGDIGTEAQTKNGDKRPYEMCYFDADGKMQNGTNASGTSYCGIFIVELSSFADVDTLSLWGIDEYGLGWMFNDGYDIYYSVDGESYTAVNGASYEDVLAKQDTDEALYVAGNYNGKDGYVHDIAMGDVTAKYIAIAVSDYIPASDNPEKEMIFYEIVVTGTATKLMLEDGASVRMSTPTGIRFTGYANKSYVDGLKTETNEVKLGMLITPTEYLAEVNAFTKADLDACDTIQNAYKYLEIDATTVLDDGDNYQINCTMVNVLEYNYDREFSAILYVKVTEGDTTEYIYSAYNKAINSRSVAYVASLALSDVQDTQDDEYKYPVTVYGQDKYSPYDTEDRKVLEKFSNATSLITVMTYNIKAYGEGDVWDKWFGNEVGWDGRNPVYALETITEVMPDVVGLQEDDDYLDAEYKNVPAITENYTRFNANGNGEENNEILVKTSKFEVLNDGVEYYKVLANDSKYKSNVAVSNERVDWDNDTKGTNESGRFFRWVLVKDKDTGEQFLVVNTHLHYMAHLSDEEQLNDDCNKYLRQAQATLLRLWLTDMSKTCANQIVMGDLNSNPDAQSTRGIVEGAGALDMAFKDADFKGDVGGTLVDSCETRNSKVFDYVLYNSDSLNALEYSVIDNYDTDSNYTKYPSDHLPVYAKFIVK